MNCVSITYFILFTLLFPNYTSSVVKINDALLRKSEIQVCFFFPFCCGAKSWYCVRDQMCSLEL